METSDLKTTITGMAIQAIGAVYKNPKPYLKARNAMHPSIVNLGKNELLCLYDIGEGPESMDYRTYRSRSLDNGESWRFEGPVITEKTERPTTSTVRTSKHDNELVAFGARFHRDNPDQGILNRKNLGVVPMELIVIRSQDNGATWSNPQVIQPPLAGPGFEICHSIVELADGRWLLPTSTWRGWDGVLPNGNKSVVFISHDRGETWSKYGVTFDGAKDGLIHWEQSLITLRNKQVVISWAYDSDNQRHLPNRYAVSDDLGETFSFPREFGLNAQTCKALAINDNQALLAYRSNDRPGLWLSLTQFDGDKLEILNDYHCWGQNLTNSGMLGGNNSDELSALKFGYPQMSFLDDGMVLLVFWCLEDWNTEIKWFKLRLDNL